MSERPRHSHEFSHFGELLTSRIVSEAMTQFDADTPLNEILEWMHDRLSIQEGGRHVVDGFSADMVKFQPTFGINAIKHEVFADNSFKMDARFPVTPTDPEFISMNAWFTGSIPAGAYITGQQPRGKYYHYDDFSNVQYSWGRASHVGYYTYTNRTHELNHVKADYDTNLIDEVFDYQGRVVETYDTFYSTYVQDDGLMNKRVLLACKFGAPTQIASITYRIHFRGPDNYVEFRHGLSAQYQRLFVDGVQRNGDVNYSSTMNNMVWLKIEALDRFVRFKVWDYEASEPSAWSFEYENASLTAGQTYINFRGVPYSFIVFNPNGSPWTHSFKHFSVEGINAGPVFTDAWLAGRFSAAAWFSSGNDMQLDAFVLPTFRADSLIVEYVPGSFTIGAFREGRWEYDWSANAFIEGWKTIDAVLASDAVYGSHTADAWKVITTESSYVEDAVVKDVDREYSFTADAITKDLDLSGAIPVNAYKNLLIEDDHTIDGYLGPGAHPPADAVVKRPDQPGSFTAGSWLWPQGVELFVINAIRHVPDILTGTGTLDAAFDSVGEGRTHYDEFNRTVDTTHMGWGNPSGATESGAGGYWYKQEGTSTDVPASEMYRFTVEGGTGRFYEKNHTYSVNTEMAGNDREVGFDIRVSTTNLVGGYHAVGIHGTSWAHIGNYIEFRISHDDNYSAANYLYVNGVQRATWNKRTIDIWTRIKAKLVGSELWYKVWHRDSEAEPGWTYLDMSAYWTPADGRSYYLCKSGNYFGTKGPWTQQFDNWYVKEAPHPEWFGSNAVIKTVDNEATAGTIDGYFVPQPFTMDAFIEGWKSIDARIWLGTTFPSDAVTQVTNTYGGLELIPGGSVGSNGGTTYWQYNNTAGIVGAEQAKVSSGGINNTGSIKSKETFGPTFGNAFPSITNRKLTFYVSVVHRDNLRVGVYDASLGTTGNNYSGFYGFYFSDYSNTVDTIVNGSQSSAGSFSPSLTSIKKIDIEYRTINATQSQMRLYVEDSLVVSSILFTTPNWASFRIGFYTAYGLVGGDNWIWYTPQLGSWKDPGTADAWIVSGDHIPFDAFITGKHANAIIKKPDNVYDHTIDVVKHALGEQLRSFPADAYMAGVISQIYKTQFGWADLGRLMWGDVSPEREQLHLAVAAILKAATSGSFTIDATRTTAGAYDTKYDAQLGTAQLGVAQLGRGNLELLTAENMWNYANDDEEAPMTNISQFLWEQFK